ncbi:hypothetical protein HY989_03855 [Candidatus Micrarchaeota archaeon]|nr:hypothetical protein [Candidatus Micrarchaeota archaeon]
MENNLKRIGKLEAIAALLLMLFIFQNLSAASVSYSQDGLPYLANGTSTSSINFINAQDDDSFNISQSLANTISSSTNMVLNGNFTAGSPTSWAYAETDASNRASSTFLAIGGDIEPGRWRFRLSDNSNAQGYSVQGNLTNTGVFWDGTTPVDATLNFSFYKNYNTAPTADVVSVYLLRPDGSQILLWTNATIFSNAVFSSVGLPISPAYFNIAGTYQIRMHNRIITPASGTMAVDHFWDQISLVLQKSSSYYSFDVWHNSTSITTPSNPAQIIGINATLRFKADFAITPKLEIYNFNSDLWVSSDCSPTTAIVANTWYLWNCDILSSASQYVSNDANKKLRVRFYSPDAQTTMANISSDLLNFTVFYNLPQAYVAVSKPSYQACGNAYYQLKLFDKNLVPFTSAATVNITISNSTSSQFSTLQSVAGGVYSGSYSLSPKANSGNWQISALSGAYSNEPFYVATGGLDVWKINLLFSDTKGRYSQSSSIPVSFNILNLNGIEISGLQPNGNLLLFRDNSLFSAPIADYANGTYSFLLDFSSLSAGSSHKLTVMANSSAINVSASQGFFVI